MNTSVSKRKIKYKESQSMMNQVLTLRRSTTSSTSGMTLSGMAGTKADRAEPSRMKSIGATMMIS